ncbi:MAG: YebC/PmpR family DNA-binding transcriptional regulator [Holophagaceae bacterium]
MGRGHIFVGKSLKDAKRGSLWTKILKEITVAARLGGGDPNANSRLRLAIDQAKQNNMPKDNYERAIKKGTGELEGVTYEEVVYEAYGPGGTAMIIEAMTDNKNRTTPEIRSYFSKIGSDLAAQNSVNFLFTRIGQIVIDQSIPEEKLMEVALEAGAEDIVLDGPVWIVKTTPQAYESVKQAIDQAQIPTLDAKIVQSPSTTVQLEGTTLTQFLKLVEAIEDNDDVQHVWHNAEYESIS